MKFFKNIKKSIICIGLAALTVALPVLSSFASNENQKLYVKDVKFLYGEDLNDAKKHLPEGYTMLETDLNQGAAYLFAVDDVYLCYSTTTDPKEAITDIRMMNMKGGFVMSDYEEQMKNVSDKVQRLADHFKCACDAFVENYKAGTNGAKSAYVALNFFTVDEADNIGLGSYLTSKEVPESFYAKLILNAHTDILSSILSALTMAVQGEKGNTWLDRLEEIENPKMNVNAYWDNALEVIPVFENFFEIYNSIDHDIYRNTDGEINVEIDSSSALYPDDVTENGENPSVDNTGTEILYEMAYDTLELYSFKNGISVAEWFVKEDLEVEHLYPLIKVLTPAEFSMMCLSGPMFMTLATGMDEAVYSNYKSEIEKLVGEVGNCSVWYGVNAELFRSSIGITDAANRAIAESNAERELSNDGDSSNDTLLNAAGMVASIGAIALGTGLILSKTLGGIFALCHATKIAAGLTIAGNFTMIAGLVVICVAAVMALVHVALWLKEWYDQHHPVYSTIPNYMYDLVLDDEDNSKFVLYEAVKASDGKNTDVNAWEGKEWHAPYVSRDPAAGKPIEADFKIKLGDGRVDEGYAPLRAFGSVVAENLNRYADNDDVKGIYISYRQEIQKGAYAKGKYLSDIKFFSDKNESLAKTKVAIEGFTLYNLNLTPSTDKYTYIGYKTSDNTRRALTDIRVCYGYSAAQYNAGGANGTYAASGSAANLTLYTTRVSLFGTPILSDFIITTERNSAPEGYEPVNMITGGPAVNLNMGEEESLRNNDLRLMYFLPTTTYTSGTKYLSGIATIYDRPADGHINEQNSVLTMINHMGYTSLAYVTGNPSSEGAVVYSTTYNPYRAMYGIMAMSNGGAMGNSFVQCIRYDNINYSLATRYYVDTMGDANVDLYPRKNDSRIYTTGIYPDGKPMTLSDIIVTEDDKLLKEGYYPLSAILLNSSNAVDLSKAFNYSYKTTIQDDVKVTVTVSMPSLYVYTTKAPKAQLDYITNIYISSKDSVITGVDGIDCDDVDNSYLTASLSSMGATSIIRKNLNLEDGDNTTYMALSRDAESGDPITDLFIYFEKDSKKEPPRSMIKNDMKYNLVSDINMFAKEGKANSKSNRVYIYATTNPLAGDPIIDISIDNNHIKNGWTTAKTHNAKVLHKDIDDYEDDMWFLHIKRSENEPHYVGNIVIGWGGSKDDAMSMLVEAGCDYFVDKDLNDNCSIVTDYVYLGYTKTDNKDDAIRNLRTTHDNPISEFIYNGAAYYKIEGNLNVYTNIFADDIYLYYTKDPNAGEPIINLTTSSSVIEDGTLGFSSTVSTVVNQHDKPSDLNDGAAGDYIYLIMHRDYIGDTPEWYENHFQGAMLGTGSAIAICICIVASVAMFLGVVILQKTKSKKTIKTNKLK